jgi:hypothetical protein
MFSEPQDQHEMILATIHPSGAEEWFCPTCGRRFLMQWPPAYNKVILVPGDESAIHSGGKGSLSMDLFQTQQERPREEEEVAVDEDRLQPWVEWMEAVNFERFWTQ